MAFTFSPRPFVQEGFESAPGDWGDSDRREIAAIRDAHPELSHWGDLAIGMAWSDYSHNVYLISWWNFDGNRDEHFLNYCCWEQTRGLSPWGGSVDDLAKANEWRED
jgi:hypothetical protein